MHVGPEEVFARGNDVSRRVTARGGVEAGRQVFLAAQSVVVGEDLHQVAEVGQQTSWVVSQGSSSQVHLLQTAHVGEPVTGDAVQRTEGQVQALDLREVDEGLAVERGQPREGQVDGPQAGVGVGAGVGRRRRRVKQGHQRVSRETQLTEVGQGEEDVEVQGRELVATKVQSSQKRERHLRHVATPTRSQPQPNEVDVAVEVTGGHSRPAGVDVVQVREPLGHEGPLADEGPALAEAAWRTVRFVAKHLVVALRALGPAVAQMVGVQTHAGGAAAVEPRAGEAPAVRLVLVVRAVRHPVAAHVDGQAVAVARAPEVSFRAGLFLARGVVVVVVVVNDSHLRLVAVFVVEDDSGRRHGVSRKVHHRGSQVALLVRPVHAVHDSVARLTFPSVREALTACARETRARRSFGGLTEALVGAGAAAVLSEVADQVVRNGRRGVAVVVVVGAEEHLGEDDVAQHGARHLAGSQGGVLLSPPAVTLRVAGQEVQRHVTARAANQRPPLPASRQNFRRVLQRREHDAASVLLATGDLLLVLVLVLPLDDSLADKIHVVEILDARVKPDCRGRVEQREAAGRQEISGSRLERLEDVETASDDPVRPEDGLGVVGRGDRLATGAQTDPRPALMLANPVDLTEGLPLFRRLHHGQVPAAVLAQASGFRPRHLGTQTDPLVALAAHGHGPVAGVVAEGAVSPFVLPTRAFRLQVAVHVLLKAGVDFRVGAVEESGWRRRRAVFRVDGEEQLEARVVVFARFARLEAHEQRRVEKQDRGGHGLHAASLQHQASWLACVTAAAAAVAAAWVPGGHGKDLQTLVRTRLAGVLRVIARQAHHHHVTGRHVQQARRVDTAGAGAAPGVAVRRDEAGRVGRELYGQLSERRLGCRFEGDLERGRGFRFGHFHPEEDVARVQG